MPQEKKDTQREKERLSKNAKHHNKTQEEFAKYKKTMDWFPSCVVQYSTVLLGKLFWVVSNLYF
jgi:hypothetical protein